MLRPLTTGQTSLVYHLTSCRALVFAACWCCSSLSSGPHALAADLICNAFTRGNERISGRLTGDTPEDLRFVLPDGVALSLDRIQSLDLPILPRTLPDRGWKRVRLRNGDALHAKATGVSVPSFGQQSTTRVKWLTGFGPVVDLPLSAMTAVSHPSGTRCLVYEDFETEATNWKTPTGAAISRDSEQSRSGESSLKCSATEPAFQCDLPRPLSKGRVEFSFFLDPQAIPQGNCTALLKARLGQEPVELQIGLLGSQPWYETRLPGEVDWQCQNIPRRPGWHVIGIEWKPDEIQMTIDGFSLVEGHFKQAATLQLESVGVMSSLKSGALWIDDFAVVEPSTESSVAMTQTDSDQFDLASGDQLFGMVRGIDSQRVLFTAGDVDSQLDWSELRSVQLATRDLVSRPVTGYLVQVDLQPWSHAPALKDADSVRGALQSVDREACRLDHPICGHLTIPWQHIRRLQTGYRGQEWTLEGRGRHLGNEIKSAFTVPVPEGTRLKWSVELPTIPAGASYVALRTSDLEPAASETRSHRWLDQLREGHLTSELWVNDRRIAILNQTISGRGTADQPRRIRVRLPENSLIIGQNHIAIRLQPGIGEPVEYDDWELQELRLEIEMNR